METKKAKTVREFIAELQQLDQDKCVWQVYDFPFACWPATIEVISEDYAEELEERGVKAGDYMLECG